MNTRHAPLTAENAMRTYDIVPNDPYNIDVLTFSVLQKRGYPVSLQPATEEAVEANRQHLINLYGDRSTLLGALTEATFARHASWVVATAHHKGFRIIHPKTNAWEAGSGQGVGLREATSRTLARHPAVLAKYVSLGDVREIKKYHAHLHGGMEVTTGRPMPDPRAFTGGSLLRAIERFREPDIIGPDMALNGVSKPITAAEIDRDTRVLAQRNIRPIGTEALLGLVNDYYELVERLVPRFAAQKNFQPAPPPQ